MFLPRSPYPFWEFVGMVIRRYSDPPPPVNPSEQTLVLKEDEENAIRIGFVGDICPLRNRRALFSDDVVYFFDDCSLIVGNFEGVITDKPHRLFRLKHTSKIFDALKSIKPLQQWKLSIANNHAIDYGTVALDYTLKEFDRRGINWFGTSEKPTISISKDLLVTGWTWWLNGQSDRISNAEPSPPQDDKFNIAFPHWGYEHEREPRTSQRKRVPEEYELIVGHHSHLPQPLERLESGVPVAWSLGNFLTVKTLPVLGEGALLKVVINQPNGIKPHIHSVHYRTIILDRDDPDYCRVSFR